jgi:hypothetical protein
MLLIKKEGIGELRQDGLIVLPLGGNDASPMDDTNRLKIFRPPLSYMKV